MILETERLFVEDVNSEDASDILRIQNTEYSHRYNLFPPLTIKDIEEEIKSSTMYKLVLKEEKVIIGLIRVKVDYYRNNPQARHIMVIMDENYSSKGYMTEAILAIYEYLYSKYDILTGYIFAENIASIRLSEKSGWKNEGTLRQAIVDQHGVVHDLVAVSLTKEEYLLRKSSKH